MSLLKIMRKYSQLVSIGMPVYNGEKFIRQSLNSLIEQDYISFELIISDNASTDNTKSICLEYANRDSRIKYVCNATNEGAVKNFSKVLDIASGEYFMWAAYDDLWEPEYISTLLDILCKEDKAVIAFSMFNSIDINNNEITSYPHILNIPDDDLFQRLSNYLNQFESLGKANPIYGLMRKKFTKQAFASTSHFLINDVWGSDMLFVFKLLSLGKFIVEPKTLFHKRILPESPSVNTKEDWDSYFKGYDYLITRIVDLSHIQKQKLLRQVWDRKMSRRIKLPKRILQQTKNIITQSIKNRIKSFL
jgi:glycosyltransferase involved in cell wall biosynthesis